MKKYASPILPETKPRHGAYQVIMVEQSCQAMEIHYLKKRIKRMEQRIGKLEKRPMNTLNAWKIASITAVCSAISTILLNLFLK